MIRKTANRLLTIYAFMKEFLVVILVSIFIFIAMNYIGHIENQTTLVVFLIAFSVAKVYILISKTLKRMEVLTRDNHNVNHILLFSIIIIFFINISFTLDYMCVSKIYINSFSGFNPNQPFFLKFFDLLYFSIVTFTSVGYGDIFPFGKAVKFLTILEMTTAFITIVFIISRYTKSNERNEKE
tara:strand:+ start:4815 stop:5363 length:549 start_codon:yes stop_codon:yes gene_type:complete